MFYSLFPPFDGEKINKIQACIFFCYCYIHYSQNCKTEFMMQIAIYIDQFQTKFKGKSQEFTNKLSKAGMYRDHGLNTSSDKTRVPEWKRQLQFLKCTSYFILLRNSFDVLIFTKEFLAMWNARILMKENFLSSTYPEKLQLPISKMNIAARAALVLEREHLRFQKHPVWGIEAKPVSYDNMFVWKVRYRNLTQ